MMNKEVSILLVDDDINLSTILIELLSSNNYKIKHVGDGLKGLEAIKNELFDLILLDEMLPNMNGSELLIRIKADPKACNTPVIMMTSVKDDSYQVNVLKEGADDYIQKPFRINILEARIKSVLRRSSSSQPLKIEVPEDANPASLTPKEKEVLSLIVKGYNNSRIASEMYISESTVSNHLHCIFNKLKIESRTQAALVALKLNLVQ